MIGAVCVGCGAMTGQLLEGAGWVSALGYGFLPVPVAVAVTGFLLWFVPAWPDWVEKWVGRR